MPRSPAFYVMASERNGTLYAGVTSDLIKRVSQHKTGETGGFAAKYKTHTLVHYELYDEMEHAIVREKRVKKWRRAWKIRLIEETNPGWEDLFDTITGFPPSRE